MILTDRLENGMRVIAEPMQGVRSAAIGVWIAAGPVYELENEAGISHMIEHMLFKGTERRTAGQIAAEMDGLGGNLNAFTAKECTCYYAKVLDEHLPKAVDILQDLVQNPKLDPEDLAREQGVVCEEILMMEDSPEELVHELLGQTIYGQSPLSKPILGTQESVRAFGRDDLHTYMQRRYRPERMVVACAGHFEMPALMDMLNKAFRRADGKNLTEAAGADMPRMEMSGMEMPGMEMPASALAEGRSFAGADKDVEQAHLCLGFPGFATDTAEQFALLVMNNALGGSMSSRLFQRIREEKGLAYSVYSYPTGYSQTGYFALYAGTGEKQGPEVAQLMLEEARAMREKGVTEEEFLRAKEQLKGSYMLGQESSSARSGAIGRSMLLLGTAREEEDILRRIEAVRMEDVEAILPRVLDESRMAAALVARKGTKQALRKALGL